MPLVRQLRWPSRSLFFVSPTCALMTGFHQVLRTYRVGTSYKRSIRLPPGLGAVVSLPVDVERGNWPLRIHRAEAAFTFSGVLLLFAYRPRGCLQG